ncbi:hypothetical protein Niako_7226 [Niastella koreensis GR20-10]|uniref:Uncharacterized protein n=1 Tax=Niastella koreensis (strain DSM 17620 / KACC 11465 / NBRC 106392 / GR20-10) TaxID=700598 RepID=G8TBE2_NIAKG|nr:hypothetical protein Niako_7226 [Niastella koreensis GR20-10]
MVFGLLGCPVFRLQVVRFNGATVNYLSVIPFSKHEDKVDTIDQQEIV